jgi:hypothetical protein
VPATLAFSNDIDFADWDSYREAHRVLRDGFGIEADESFWLFDPAGSDLALFRGSVKEKGPRHDELLQEIAEGRCSILHSAGNFTNCPPEIRCSRGLVEAGLAYLREHAVVPKIWVNHGGTADIQNIGGAEPVYQQGDDPQSPAYILDLLLDAGVKYFWHDRGSTNDFVLASPTRSSTILSNERTRSGHTITCFRRFRGALERAPDAQTLGQQLTADNLAALVAEQGTTIIYQHWCAHRDVSGRPFTAGRPIFPPQSHAALALLADYRDRGLLRIPLLSALLEELPRPVGPTTL